MNFIFFILISFRFLLTICTVITNFVIAYAFGGLGDPNCCGVYIWTAGYRPLLGDAPRTCILSRSRPRSCVSGSNSLPSAQAINPIVSQFGLNLIKLIETSHFEF